MSKWTGGRWSDGSDEMRAVPYFRKRLYGMTGLSDGEFFMCHDVSFIRHFRFSYFL
jgi:hypothetical protein